MPTILKKVAAILDPPAPHMVGDGFRVHNFFPNGYRIKMDPFYLLDYNSKIEFPGSDKPRGVGVHPHRGFETVTIAYHGAVAHHDSAGNSGVIYPGDVQWMTAASGILHKEYHEEKFNKSGGFFQMVQLWVNLPTKYKMSAPKYQAIANNNMVKANLPDNNGFIEVVAGNYQGITGSASTFTPIEMYNLKLNSGTKISLTSPANYNTALLVIEGSLLINGKEAFVDQMVHFAHEGTDIEIEAIDNATALFLSGEPIGEPIAQYGPFLMNRPEELQQAISDYNTGKFGYLDE
jgi:redox-sensitive bicupin YhaK (pirin superfamily)